jgi:hypothetical protein
MLTFAKRSRSALYSLAAMLLFTTAGLAQIPSLCNTGETRKLPNGCSGTLVTPNPPGGGPNLDANWAVAYVDPAAASKSADRCVRNIVEARVDTPNAAWMPDSASTASEWITPFDGENNQRPGYYVYATFFPISDSPAPLGFTINGQLASDNAVVAIYLSTPSGNPSCYLVSGQTFPVNPAGQGSSDFTQWWPFSFTNPVPLAVASPAALYFVVQNPYDPSGPSGASPTGLRIEFFSTSSFSY